MLPPYQARPYESQGVGRMSDLIMRRGDAQARAALQQGAIAAQKAQALGGIIGGTMSDLARQVSTNAERAKVEARQKQADERQRVLDDRATTLWNERQADQSKQATESMAMSKAIRQTDDGHWVYDRDLLTSTMKDAGLGDRVPTLLKTIDDIEASSMRQRAAKMKLEEATKETIGKAAYAISQADRSGLGKAQAFRIEAERLVKNGVVTEADVAPYVQRLTAAPGEIDVVLKELMKGAGIEAKPKVFNKNDVIQNPDGTFTPVTPREPTIYKEGDVIERADGTREKIPRTKAPGGDGESGKSLTPYQREQLRTKADARKDSRLSKAEENAKAAIAAATELTTKSVPSKDGPVAALTRETFIQQKNDIYRKLEAEKQRIYRDYESDIAAIPSTGNAPTSSAPASGTAQAPAKVITTAQLESVARKRNISLAEAKANAESRGWVVR